MSLLYNRFASINETFRTFRPQRYKKFLIYANFFYEKRIFSTRSASHSLFVLALSALLHFLFFLSTNFGESQQNLSANFGGSKVPKCQSAMSIFTVISFFNMRLLRFLRHLMQLRHKLSHCLNCLTAKNYQLPMTIYQCAQALIVSYS